MTTVTIPGFIHATPAHDWEIGMEDIVDGHRMLFSIHEELSSSGYVTVCPHTLTFEIPEGWDPRAQQVEALKAKKESLKREFADAVMKINQQIASLQAIEFTEAA